MQHNMRRKNRTMLPEEAWALLERGVTAHLGTADEEGWPYVVPLTYAVHDGAVYFHHTPAAGHLRANVEVNPRVCLEVAEPGCVFPIGEEDQCDTSISFQSVILFGTCTLVTDRAEKLAALRTYMAKYADPAWERPDAWPLLDGTAVYKISVERITGKRRPATIAPKWQHLFREQA